MAELSQCQQRERRQQRQQLVRRSVSFRFRPYGWSSPVMAGQRPSAPPSLGKKAKLLLASR